MCTDRVATSQFPWKHDGSRSRERQVTRQERTLQQRKRKTPGQEQRKRQRETSHVSCARDLTGLVTVLHIMVERASVSTHLARDTRILHRFDKLPWKATSMIGSQVVPSLQNFASFDLDGKFILDSGATTLPRNQTCTNEPCRQSNLCPHREKTNPRPRKSSPMSCVDFFCWKTQRSLVQTRSLFSVLLEKVTRTITLQTH